MKERLKRIANLSGKTIQEFDGDKKYYSTGNINTDNYEVITYKNRPSRANLQVTEKDILIAKMKNTNKTTIVTKEMENHIYSTGFTVLNTEKLYYRYLYYLLCSPEFIEKKDVFSVGTTQIAINDETLMNLELEYIQDYKEQKKIAAFLDNKTAEINNVIEKTKDTIEDYKKIKYSLMFDKITKGMKKNIELKETGNIHIGKIPSNWSAKKIKYIFEIKKDIAGKEGYDILSITQNGIKIKDVSKNEGQLAANYSNYQLVEVGDFAMNHMDLLTGWVDISKYNGVTSPDYRVFRFINKENDDSKYYLYLMQMCYMGKIFYDLGQGVSNLGRWRLQTDKFLNFIVPNPPIKEQKEISNYLETRCNEIDKLILNKENLIEELEEYKKSLIYEYVTGKKKVENDTIIKTNLNGIKINCKDNIFAQAILLCRVIEKLNNYNLGRVKAEKTLYLIEKDIGFDFDNNYVREAAGPLSESIYKCESVISKKNKWIKVNKVKRHIEYEILSDFSKYSKYYDKYYSDYNNQIEEIIEKVKNYSTDKSEMVATLYASWNDFIIKKEDVTDIKIVKDVRENWNDTKKRFNEQKWLDVLEEMKGIELTPKGNGNLTIIKEN